MARGSNTICIKNIYKICMLMHCTYKIINALPWPYHIIISIFTNSSLKKIIRSEILKGDIGMLKYNVAIWVFLKSWKFWNERQTMTKGWRQWRNTGQIYLLYYLLYPELLTFFLRLRMSSPSSFSRYFW